MRFIDLTTKYHITQDKIKIAISTTCIIIISIIALISIKTILNTEAEAERQRRIDEASDLLSDANTSETSTSTVETSIPEDLEGDLIIRESDNIVPTSESTTTESTETTDVDSSEETAETTSFTSETTEATTTGITETPLYLTLYASQEVNLRSGPGTEYDLVRTLNAGDAIDIIAETSNGWYKTYNGNYIYSLYTTSTPPQTTSSTSETTTTVVTTVTVVTTAETTTEATTATAVASGTTVSCTITFYGPQLLSDGSYSTTTATGTTCTEGRTVAADWSMFPSGTVIYIENDPLGGDGYYTVEDKGPGVSGYHIDIYADSPSDYTSCTRSVTVS